MRRASGLQPTQRRSAPEGCGRTDPRFPTAGPSTIPEDRRIKDLSDSEVNGWSAWYSGLLHHPASPSPPAKAIDAMGYAGGYAGRYGRSFFAPVCMPDIPVEYCEKNLKLEPCEATVAELNDCLLTILRHVPTPHGCGRMLEGASCSNLFIHGPGPNGPSDGGITNMPAEICNKVKVQ